MKVDPPAKKPVETRDTTLRPVSRDAKEKQSFTLSDILNFLPLSLALVQEKKPDTIDADEAAGMRNESALFCNGLQRMGWDGQRFRGPFRNDRTGRAA
eukprot:gene2816-1046_t